MKNKLDHLLACLSEECGEVIQAVGKTHRFGILDINPKTQCKNWEEIHKEFHDIVAVYEMLCAELGHDSTINQNLIDHKKQRVEKYMGYARELGELSQ